VKTFIAFLAGILVSVALAAGAVSYIGFNPNTGVQGLAGALIDYSPGQTATGCSLSALKGGNNAGQLTAGVSGTCTITFTESAASPNGWTCYVVDFSAPSYAAVMKQTAVSTTSCTVSGTTVSGDTLVYIMMGY
jgi:hypothetical protein